MNPPWLRPQKDGVALAVKVQPRASRSEIVGVLGQELKIRITAPPVDSAANQALIEFIADKLDCPRQSITLVRGSTSRSKILLIHGITPSDIEKKLSTGLNSLQDLSKRFFVKQRHSMRTERAFS